MENNKKEREALEEAIVKARQMGRADQVVILMKRLEKVK